MASGWPSLSQHYTASSIAHPLSSSLRANTLGHDPWLPQIPNLAPLAACYFDTLCKRYLLTTSIIICPRIATKLTGVCYSTVQSPEGGLEFQSRAVVTVPPLPHSLLLLPNLRHYVLNQYTHQAQSWPYHYYCHIVTIRIGFRGKCQNDHLLRLVQNYSKQ